VELEQLARETFVPLVDSTFAVGDPGASALGLRLAGIGAAGAGLPGHRVPFSLIFHGPLQPLLSQGIHRLLHPELGEIAIFLVPVGPAGQAMQYQAIFS
jgi:hypothetical protein